MQAGSQQKRLVGRLLLREHEPVPPSKDAKFPGRRCNAALPLRSFGRFDPWNLAVFSVGMRGSEMAGYHQR